MVDRIRYPKIFTSQNIGDKGHTLKPGILPHIVNNSFASWSVTTG